MLGGDTPYDFAEKKYITRMNKDEINYLMTPVPKAVYKNRKSPIDLPFFNGKKQDAYGHLLDNVEKPIYKSGGQNVYANSWNGRTYGKKPAKAQPTDRLICEFCGKTYTRSNRSTHRKTEVCKAYQSMNKKLKDVLLRTD
ncbi:V4 [Sputnik virophage]|uniref:Uncharacterized protein V4 n=3 Tax=Mimivirus-dependent virus Sputnik TaxID=1932927 RepID=V4_SPTNK|nr:V4 [Sputnik virophage]B4YNE4.1 RecName: Full=Uncharacterized protein V4 [Sputnik virophage]AFH75258.1 hypothetical protein Sputnik2_R4 [Sputnik virophage 2]AFH75278.1 hypothetical protein Sputnik3_R4 [Sputnik virophage 3]UMZ08516.1 C2H2-type zinc finger-containing protein [Mimivirus-dependent virus Sputnik]VAV82185.1 hypothetical protein GUARANI_6 [Guarani virophage]ACF16988.1 V4 [Sputnik virophage]